VEENGERTTVARVCEQSTPEHRQLLQSISSNIIPALLLISELFLFVTFILHILVLELRKQIFGWMKMSMVAALFLGYQWFLIILLSGPLLLSQPGLCRALPLLMQNSFLVAFSWMSAMSWEVWVTFRQMGGSRAWEERQRGQRTRFRWCSLLCWGVPTILTVVTAIIEFMPTRLLVEGTLVPGLGLDKCFFSSYSAQVAYFHGPLALLLVFNLSLFLSSAYSLLFGIWAIPREDTNSTSSRGSRQMFWIVLELFLVLGLTWLADIISLALNWVYGSIYIGYEVFFFDAFNALQGFFIFLVLVCKSRIRSLIKRSISDACSTALNCLPRMWSKPSEKDHLKAAVSAPTALSAVSPSLADLQQVHTRRRQKLLQSLTPTWKRGSYNLDLLDDKEPPAIHTISINESRC